VLSLIAKDLKAWDNKTVDTTQRIFISVTGGLGDQLSSQPAIRKLREILPDSEIHIETHFPELFTTIENINTYKPNGFVTKNDTAYFLTNSFPSPETVTYSVIGTIMCHTVDYCSIALLKRLLPNIDKSFSLDVDSLDSVQNIVNANLKNLVLIHAGKHWETKTMPKEWWNDVIDGLVALGIPVCLIGKTGDSRGASVWEFDRKDVINTVDLLDIKELIALISQAQILVSNDSSPIHIAGAFDNWIIGIPTVKHPEHIFPYRFGTTTYKTVALYKDLLLSDYPTSPLEVNEVSVAKLLHPWDKYLVDPQEVVDAVKGRWL
jgi:ADP-heptose:LPS heptosyltransferase